MKLLKQTLCGVSMSNELTLLKGFKMLHTIIFLFMSSSNSKGKPFYRSNVIIVKKVFGLISANLVPYFFYFVKIWTFMPKLSLLKICPSLYITYMNFYLYRYKYVCKYFIMLTNFDTVYPIKISLVSHR